MSRRSDHVDVGVDKNVTTPRKERTTKSEDRTLADVDRNVADDQRRASASYADVSPNQHRDPKADFFHKLVAKVTTEDNDDEADRVQRSTTSLDSAAVASVDEKEKTASTSSLNIDAGVDKTDGRPNKFSELSRSNACLETATASASSSSAAAASALKYASCFSISRMKAHNIASYNEFNQETEQVRLRYPPEELQ